MEIKKLFFEPHITLLSNLSLFLHPEPEKSINHTIVNKYQGLPHYYIEEQLNRFQNQFLHQHRFREGEVVKHCLEFLIRNLFSDFQIKELQLFKVVTSEVRREFLLQGLYVLKNLSTSPEILESASIKHHLNTPSYLNHLADLHTHIGLFSNFPENLEFLMQNFEHFNKVLKDAINSSREEYRSRCIKVKKLIYILANLWGFIKSPRKVPAEVLKTILRSIYLSNSFTLDYSKLTYQELRSFNYFNFVKSAICNLFSKTEDKRYLGAAVVTAVNTLYRETIHDRRFRGLDYFSRKFVKNPIKKELSKLPNYVKGVTIPFARKQKELQILEFRLFPSIGNIKRIHNTVNHIKEEIPNLKVGFILHYPKFPKAQDLQRLNVKEKELFEATKKLVLLFQKEPELLNHFLGIDTASQEYWTPAWFFAPLYRFWRKKAHFIIPKLLRKGAPPLRFTYHAGEDYVDIATGLKSIHEALLFLELNSNDRIGHGLAVLREIKSYSIEYRNVQIDPLRYFFHLLWLFYATYRYQRLSKYHRRVGRELTKFFQKHQPQNPVYQDEFLLRTYEALKFNIYPLGEKSPTSLLWEPKERNEYVKEINFVRSLIEQLRGEKESYSLNPLFNSEEFFSVEEQLEFLRDIQKTIIEELIKRQIAVEVCPSSNQFIERLPDYMDYLSEETLKLIKAGKLKAFLNSDDPLTFDTTVLEEYLLLREALPEGEREEIIKTLIGNAREATFIA